MKTSKLILFFLVSGLLFLMTCKKIVKEMAVTTGSVTEITITTAKATGQVLDIGEGATTCGHCYATTAHPTVSGTKTELDNPVVGKYISNLTGLSASTKYYVRAYLARGSDVVYGSDSSFTTLSNAMPVLTTTTVTDISKTTAVSGGNITSQGGTPVTARGVCWSLATAPTIALTTKTSDGSGTGSFSSSMTGLTAGTKYYVRAYATNSGNTAYGNELSFTTSSDIATPPVVTTAAVSSITVNSAVCGGDVTNEGGSSVTAKGVCWSASVNPTTSNFHTNDGTGPGSFVSNLTGLNPGTEYHVRAYATNGSGTSYATNELTFTALCTAPTATTNTSSSNSNTTATLNGTVNANGFSTTVTFEYGLTTSYGSTITASPSPVTGSSNTAVNAGLTGLTPNTLYHYRVTAVNCSPTTINGGDQTFTTLATVTTTAMSSITTTTASSGGTIAVGGGVSITARGVCWSTGTNPTTADSKTTDATGTGSFISNLIGLTPNTTYYVRAYATNAGGTAYGDQVSFTTDPTTITDIDGNSYNVIRIGTQLWMKENLKTTKYNDGTSIPLETDGAAWAALSTAGYCWYNNDAATNKNTYGALYNQYTVNSGKLCPAGWHVPTDEEWKTLEMGLGMTQAQADAQAWRGTDQGNQLKEAGNTHWSIPSAGTNSSGFTALPGGYRTDQGIFSNIGYYGSWRSSTNYDANYAWDRYAANDNNKVYRGANQSKDGYSVRCIK
jgi:uncharacterized protein (TIGR02145 family)